MTPRLILAGLAAAALLAAAWWFYDAGGDAREAGGLKSTIETQRSITDADAHGPRTPDVVDKRLRDGKF